MNNTPPEENVNNEQNVMEKPVQEKAIDPKSNKHRPEIKSFKTPMELKRENQIMPPLSKRQRSSKLLMATYSAKHIEKGNDGRFHCDICHRHYKEKKTLNAHIKVHFQSGAYNCSHCDRNFHNKNEFKRHEASHIDKRLYACACCSKCFKTVENLRDRVRKCQVGKPVSKVEYVNCGHCKKDFASQESLRRHLRDVLQGPYVCKVCNKKYAQFASYWRHQNVHESKGDDSLKSEIKE